MTGLTWGTGAIRSTRGRRLFVAAVSILLLLVTAADAVVIYVHVQFGHIPRIDVPLDDLANGEPMTILVVGSDSRALAQDPAAAKEFGSTKQVPGQRSDTIILVRLDLRSTHVSMLSIPRDLYVPIAGTNRRERINSAYELGAATLIQTIQQVLHVPVNHYVEVNFDAFRSVVDGIGGVPIPVQAPSHDDYSGLDITKPGCITFDGATALAWVRSRHFEERINGRLRADPTSDIGRIRRQQDFVRRLLQRAVARGARNPVVADRLLASAVRNVTLDTGFSQNQVTGLARRYRNFEPGTLETSTVPATPTTINGEEVLRLDETAATPVIDHFLGRDAPAAPTTTVAGQAPPTTAAPATTTSTTTPAITC